MANTLTGLIPVIYEAMDLVAREQQGFINAVSLDASADQVGLNQIIRSPIAPAVTAADITPGVTPPNTGDQTIDYVDLTLNKSRFTAIKWNGEEQKSVAGILSNVMRDQFANAFRTLSNEVEVDLASAALLGSSRAVGGSGTTPFATANDLTDFAAVQRVLDDNGTPMGDRFLVNGAAALANLRGKQSVLFKVNEAGTSDLLRKGIIGEVMGLNLKHSRYVTTNAAGTGANFQLNGAHTAGATSIAVDTGTGTILPGNVLTIAGDKYVVLTGTTGPGTVTIAKPGLLSALADNVPVTVNATYTGNVAFHKSAIQLAMRAPAMPQGGDAASDVAFVTDPHSGITFQIALYKMYRQIHIEVGIAWGMKVVKSEFVTTLLG